METISAFDEIVVRALDKAAKADMPDLLRQELVEWGKIVSRATDEKLVHLIVQSEISFQEEELAREFVKRRINPEAFLAVAKFWTTKAILRGQMQ